MKKIFTKIILIIFNLTAFVYANGLLMPSNQNYPKDFLRNTVTEVTVNIHGEIAETIVYQEFENEWSDSTDAVYSFPLPPNARATKFLYWYNNKIYQAVLKVKEQATNPGTGEGGIAAEVNNYIGRNGIKIFLKGIKAEAIQKVELQYVNLCSYYKGKVSYNFPLNTENFVTYPLDNLQFNINVYSNSDITDFSLPDNPNYKVLQSDKKTLKIQMIKPKAYISEDFHFDYQIDNSNLDVDFYSAANDTMDGHFTLFVKPQAEAEPDSIFPRKVFFLISNSSGMYGNKLNQSIYAISKSLDRLTSRDLFNIIIFNYTAEAWQNNPISANAENIQSAKNYLSLINASSYGSDMEAAIKQTFDQIKDDQYSSSIIIFTDGRSVIDPKEIESLNIYKAGIFPIGIGDNLDRERLEMTAALNYGFVTYLNPLDNLGEEMLKVFDQISQPVLKDIAFEYGGAGVSQVIPEKLPSTYAGSLFFMTGRYKKSGESGISIAGTSVNGMRAFDFRLNFNDKTNENKFVESIWAKETIDAIEREIEVYGETAELKQRDIDLSLAYNIRCRYTAYIADYITEPTTLEVIENKDLIIPESYLAGNFPNPFNPTTNIRFFLDHSTMGMTKLIKIYNLLGELVAVIDISNFSEGWHIVTFKGKDASGGYLASGIYLVQLQVGNRIANTIKINLIK